MRNDDVIKSIRFILDVNDAAIAEILKLGGYNPSRDEVAYIFEEPAENKEKVDITHTITAHFLDGLIIHKRGKDDKYPPRPITVPVNNNTVLKKLRVAFQLRDEDIIQILKETGFNISKNELSALFRDNKHRNFKICGDQLLRYFLKGLAMRERKRI
ncbi:MAG: DUF1456 family protein [Balneolaceae bacterium]|nr:MAG: DUF1456 family protein [Balneolaceae bacterium]